MKRRPMIKTLCVLLACVLALLPAGCAAQQTAPTAEPGAQVVQMRTVDLMTTVVRSQTGEAAAVRDADADAAADFALRMFRAGYDAQKNTLVSPLSVLCALAMTANGAKGETLAEMEQTLGLSTDALNAFFRSYLSLLKNEQRGALRLADSIWFTNDPRFTVNRDFLQCNADFYDAGAFSAPFNEQTRTDINNWVKEKTNGMIEEILDEIPANAVMYLVNALAFEGKWSEPYKESDVHEGVFTAQSGEQRRVEYLCSQENRYLETDKASGILKYYGGRRYAFAALLPNEGVSVEELLSSLDGAGLRTLLSDAKWEEVGVRLPKFEVSWGSELSALLKQMGMPTAFDEDRADFSGLGVSTGGNISISRVLHKTYLSVTEEGTRAGAATAVEMTDKAIPAEPTKTLFFDRPFVYLLIDCETNIPFFVGVLSDPGAK